PWLLQATDRQLWRGVHGVRPAGGGRPGRHQRGAPAVAYHVGGALRRGRGLKGDKSMNMITPRRTRLVLVGNGMAGVRALEEILAPAPGAFSTTVFGNEPHGNYNRIMLSPVLAGEKTLEAITTHPRSWYEDNGIELIAGETVVRIDRDAKTVTGAQGTVRPYDVLLLATGSNPIIIPLPGHKLPGVIGFRDIADVETMVAASKSGTHAV